MISHSKIGLCSCEALYNNNEIVDYVIINVNNTLLQIYDLDNDVLGKKASEIFENFSKSDFYFLDIFKEKRDNLREFEFEKFFETSNKWFKIYISFENSNNFNIIFTDITDLKSQQLNNLSENSNELLKLLNESNNLRNEIEHLSHMGSWELNLVTGELTWSDEIFNIFEIDKEKFVASYKFFLDIIHPDDRDKVDKAYTDSLKNKTKYNIDHRLLFPDGRIKWVNERCQTFYDKNGNPIRSLGIVQDITERKIKEKLLNKLSKAVEQSSAMILITDINGKIEYINEKFTEVTGYTFEDVKGKTPSILKSGKHDKEFYANLWNTIKSGNVWVGEIFNKKKNGEFYWEFEHIYPVFEDGKITNFVAIKEDITQQKLLLKQIEEKEQMFLKIFHSSEIPISILNKEKFIIFNEAAAKILGYQKPEDLINKHPAELSPEYQIDGKVSYQKANEMIDIAYEKGYHRFEWAHKKANGELIIFDISLTNIIYQGENVLYCVWYDITDKKLAELALQKSEHMYRIIFENVGDAIVLARDGKIVKANKNILNLLGVDKDTIENQEFMQYIHPEDRKLVIEKHFKRLKGELPASENYEIKLIDVQGNIKHVILKTDLVIIDNKPTTINFLIDITERKNYEIEIIKNEKKYRQLYRLVRLMTDNIPDMLWAKNSKKEYIFVNKSLCENLLFAYDIEEPIGKTFQYFAAREKKVNDKNNQWYTIGENSEFNDDIVISQNKTLFYEDVGYIRGKLTYLSIIKAPLIDENGNAIGIVGSARDITEIRIAEEKLKESRAIYETIFEATGTVTILVNNDGFIIAANKETFKVTGYEYNEMINTNFLVFVHPDDREKMLSYHKLRRVSPQKVPSRYEFRYINKKGEIRYAIISVALLPDNSTSVVSFIDITELKNAEKELIKAKEKAEENEKRLLTFINAIPDIVCYKDSKGAWLLANNADLELFQLQNIDYYGKTDAELAQYTHEIYKEAFLTCMDTDEEAWIKGSISKGVEIIPTIHGNSKIYDVYKIPIFNEDGSRKALAVIGRDITELIKTQEELQKAKEKAEESDRLKSAFLANMSHEIRTPLNGIIGFTELLLMPNLSEEKKINYVDMIKKSGQRLINLINDLIDISKIEAGMMKVNISQFSLYDTLNYIHDFFKPEAETKNLEFKVYNILPEKDIIMQSDREKVYAILINLVKNAIKFTDKGSIEIGFEQKNDYLEFFVKDTGIGIPENKQEIIFERFIQADIEDRMARQGTGLGLAIVKAYVKMLGGKIWLQSREGVGSTFYFSIPYKNNLINNKDNQEKIMIHDYVTFEKGLNILIVEDDEISRVLLESSLKKLAKNIYIATNGEEAIEIAKSHDDLDVILMDMGLPIINGYQATKEIRKFNSNILIIAQTAYALSNEKELAMEAGCDLFISKPIDINELKELLNQKFKNKLL